MMLFWSHIGLFYWIVWLFFQGEKTDIVQQRPKLKDLSQVSRIAFVRQFRWLTQDYVSDKLGINGECKRRTMTRYERGNRNLKEKRTKEIAVILNVSYDSIRKYDLSNSKVLREIFWNVNSITSEAKYEKRIKKTIDLREDFELKSEQISKTSSNFNKKDELLVDKETEQVISVLHIYINKKDPKKLIEEYKFN